MKTTNYYNTFIEVAEDCPVDAGVVPAVKETKSVAAIQYEIIINNPYRYTSDDVLFSVYVERNALSTLAMEEERKKFFSKGQACFRASPLTKRYGWGVHFDAEGRMAIYGVGSEEYNKFLKNNELKHLKAVRSKRV